MGQPAGEICRASNSIRGDEMVVVCQYLLQSESLFIYCRLTCIMVTYRTDIDDDDDDDDDDDSGLLRW
jgi:hypothetical protein